MVQLHRPLLALLAAAWAATAAADQAVPQEQEKAVAWTRGPATVELGAALAEARIGEGLVFAGKEDTLRILRENGNRTGGTELGLLASSVDGENWFIIFDWDDVGFVKDDERNKIDADALLTSFKEGTEEANEERKKNGQAAIHVTGWAEAPHYDPVSHHLTWALRGRSDAGHEFINHNVRVLGRTGVMSVTLVDDPSGLARAKPRVDQVLRDFSFKKGKTYSEWIPGDKVAEYGLTALVAAGAGAAAVKTGLLAGLFKILAKAGKAVFLFLAAGAAAVVKFVKGIFGRKQRPVPAPAAAEAALPPPAGSALAAELPPEPPAAG